MGFPQKKKETIEIIPVQKKIVTIHLKSTTPLIQHKWAAKARLEMLKKQMGEKALKKENRNPEDEWLAAIHYYPTEENKKGKKEVLYGFPAIGFKLAAVNACKFTKGIKMTEARGLFFVRGKFNPDPSEKQEMVLLNTAPPVRRDDMGRLESGVACEIFRPEFAQWTASIEVEYVEGAITRDSIVNLFNVAGFTVGIGEWRPGKTGNTFGRFELDHDKSITER